MNQTGFRYIVVGLLLGAIITGCAISRQGFAEMESNTNIVKLTSANFDKHVLTSTKPVLVDFWAPWCAPCRQLAPTISQLANEYAGRVTVGSVNVDDEVALAERFKIEGLPTIFIFSNGIPAHQLMMWREKAEYQAILNAMVPPIPSAGTNPPSGAGGSKP